MVELPIFVGNRDAGGGTSDPHARQGMGAQPTRTDRCWRRDPWLINSRICLGDWV